MAANEAIAEYFAERGLDVLWRIHAPPRREPLERLAELAGSFGFPLDPETVSDPLVLRTFLQTIKGQSCERSLSYLVLRSLSQAVYSVDNVGHFGLGARRYLHFTSPIRRYPDLVVHRLLKLMLRQEAQPAGKVYGEWPPRKEMKMWAEDSSLRERRAMEVERQGVDLYRERLDEDYELNDKTLRYEAPRVGKSLGLGDTVRVRIDSVSVPQRRIELSLLGAEPSKARSITPQTASPERKRSSKKADSATVRRSQPNTKKSSRKPKR